MVAKGLACHKSICNVELAVADVHSVVRALLLRMWIEQLFGVVVWHQVPEFDHEWLDSF